MNNYEKLNISADPAEEKHSKRKLRQGNTSWSMQEEV